MDDFLKTWDRGGSCGNEPHIEEEERENKDLFIVWCELILNIVEWSELLSM